MIEPDQRLKEFATANQWDKYLAYCEHGKLQTASKALGLSLSAVRKAVYAIKKKAALNGYAPDFDMTKQMAPGFHVKGTSTMYNADGEIALQWVKTDRAMEGVEEKIREAVEVLSEEIKGTSGIELPGINQLTAERNKLSLYPITDLHVGMLAWGKECGEDQDLDIIETITGQAMDHVVAAQPNSQKAMVVFMGDFFHSEDDTNETKRGGNKLDCDGRTDKAFAVGIRIAQNIIRKVSEHHENVDVVVLPGNHDEYLSMSLKYVLQAYYQDTERVNLVMTHGVFAYEEFGATLLAFHHGHTTKPARMFEVITNDQREAWGRTKMCHCLTGHIHHQSVIDIGACKIESFRTLAAKDSYSAAAGWRSPRTLFSITYDRFQGECGRAQFNILQPTEQVECMGSGSSAS